MQPICPPVGFQGFNVFVAYFGFLSTSQTPKMTRVIFHSVPTSGTPKTAGLCNHCAHVWAFKMSTSS